MARTGGPARYAIPIVRFLAAATLAAWIGGFAFYGAAVLPRMHRAFGVAASAGITRQVTDSLNGLGVAAVALGWIAARSDPAGRSRSGLGLLATTTALLVLLVVLHRVMDARLDAGRRDGFYGLHRLYLIISTLQWLANLGLLALATAARGRETAAVPAGTDA